MRRRSSRFTPAVSCTTGASIASGVHVRRSSLASSVTRVMRSDNPFGRSIRTARTGSLSHVEITLDVEYGGRGKDPWGNERIGFTAKASLDRKDFGLRWNQALEAGGVLVGDRVEIDLEVQAVKAAAAQAA